MTRRLVRVSPPPTPSTPALPPVDPEEEFQGGGNLRPGLTAPLDLHTTPAPPRAPASAEQDEREFGGDLELTQSWLGAGVLVDA